LIYNEPFPQTIIAKAKDYLANVLAAYIEIMYLKRNKDFFPGNNKLYIAVSLQKNGVDDIAMVSIPSENVPRFFYVDIDDKNYIIFNVPWGYTEGVS